ncbi:MAG TPA: type VI secretion system baseplate subunit TssF [Phycisphaerae bacterium]|nr:type VI secretion system baseplate subunit TssF [Phycisphaerae bacterium]HPM22295.1 type VI secretion system baseplate subunit TssF [Phycisphaerae bacterium]HQL53207.1 type VI secretion system baseplate subunit TssF [Phycisphaerae bacterium]
MSNTYYQDELRYLREVGPEFARANPELARYLADPGSDPDVERLLEGVAFLCGRIRQKLDDELPELTASLMSLLWPHYLRPIPSLTIMELLPEVEGMQAPVRVEPGAEFASRPIDGTRCRYRSTWPVTLRPWVMRDARLEAQPGQPARLVLTLQVAAKAKLEDLELDSVRLHLAGDPRTAFTLYLLLAAHVAGVTVSNGARGGARREFTLPPGHVHAAGLDRAEAVIPYPTYIFPGYGLIQDYFAFKERFLFVDVRGLDRAVRALPGGDTLEVTFTFNRRLETYPLVAPENVRLHCLPAVNLFAHHAEPIRLSHDRVRYLVQPARAGLADRRHAEVFSVDRVLGLVRAQSLEAHEFQPFYSFAHLGTHDPRAATYYQVHLTPSMIGDGARWGTDTFVSFVVGGEAESVPAEETISIELTCTNRDLPRELRAGDICDPTDRSPAGVRFRNLVKPTPTISPPLGGGLHWRLISHLSLNYVSLTRVEHFRELLRVYDFQSAYDAQRALAHQRLLDGIVAIRSTYRERMLRGAPLRGVQAELDLNEDHFVGEGDAYLFAAIVDRFLAAYVTINAFSQLRTRFVRTGQIYTFPPRAGEQSTPAEARDDGR